MFKESHEQLYDAAHQAIRNGDYAAAYDLAKEGLQQLQQSVSSDWQQTRFLVVMGDCAEALGRFRDLLKCSSSTLSILRKYPHGTGLLGTALSDSTVELMVAHAGHGFAHASLELGDYDAAVTHGREAAATFKRRGDAGHALRALYCSAHALRARGQSAAAAEEYLEVNALAKSASDWEHIYGSHDYAIKAFEEAGQKDRAAKLRWESLSRWYRDLGSVSRGSEPSDDAYKEAAENRERLLLCLRQATTLAEEVAAQAMEMARGMWNKAVAAELAGFAAQVFRNAGEPARMVEAARYGLGLPEVEGSAREGELRGYLKEGESHLRAGQLLREAQEKDRAGQFAEADRLTSAAADLAKEVGAHELGHRAHAMRERIALRDPARFSEHEAALRDQIERGDFGAATSLCDRLREAQPSNPAVEGLIELVERERRSAVDGQLAAALEAAKGDDLVAASTALADACRVADGRYEPESMVQAKAAVARMGAQKRAARAEHLARLRDLPGALSEVREAMGMEGADEATLAGLRKLEQRFLAEVERFAAPVAAQFGELISQAKWTEARECLSQAQADCYESALGRERAAVESYFRAVASLEQADQHLQSQQPYEALTSLKEVKRTLRPAIELAGTKPLASLAKRLKETRESAEKAAEKVSRETLARAQDRARKRNVIGAIILLDRLEGQPHASAVRDEVDELARTMRPLWEKVKDNYMPESSGAAAGLGILGALLGVAGMWLGLRVGLLLSLWLGVPLAMLFVQLIDLIATRKLLLHDGTTHNMSVVCAGGVCVGLTLALKAAAISGWIAWIAGLVAGGVAWGVGDALLARRCPAQSPKRKEEKEEVADKKAGAADE